MTPKRYPPKPAGPTVSAKKPSVNPDLILATINNWDDLRARLTVLTNIEKGNTFERLTQLYLQLSPAYQCKLRHVWLRHEVPRKLVSKLNLPSTDKGIDLVAETFDGKYWAIQCKYRDDETARITWDELSTFIGLAFGVCRNFSFGLICSSTEHMTSVLQNKAHIGFCAIDQWRHLDQDFFDAVKLKLVAKPVVLTPKKPRPHQERALEKGIEYFADPTNTRGKLIAPCGSGKSLTGFWLAEALKSRLSLVAVPSLALIRQTLNVWLRECVALGKPADWLCVCSDESTGQVQQDDLIVFAHDLGIPCTTNENEIMEWMSKESASTRILFTTYQSALVVSAAAKKADCQFDIGILDEAHKTVGRRDRLFSHLLFDENIKIARRIFMTATERQYRGDSEEIVTMDDETIYGDTFELLTFKEAIEAQPPILSDYEVLIIGISNDEVHQLIQSNAFVRPEQGTWGDLDAHTFAGLIAFRKAISLKGLNIKHAVSFHKSIAGARRFTELQETATNALSNCTPIHAFHVSGQMTTAERDTILQDFAESPPSLVTNARCLTEGVDVPKIDCVFFADPRKSAIDIVQASGRAMRSAAGKTKGYIVVPVYVPTGAADDDIAASSAFNAVFNILRALASNDERIVEYFRAITQGRRPSSSLVQFNVDEIIPLNVTSSDFAKALELHCWNKLATLSWRPFEEARSFVHSLNLRSYTEWRQYCNSGNKPPDIPGSPVYVYVEKWSTWGDWLGNGNVAAYLIEYRPFEEARTFVRGLGFKNQDQWKEYCRSRQKPADIPAAPSRTYRNQGWNGMPDWLGTTRQYRSFRSFVDARAYVQGLGLDSVREWQNYCDSGKKPADIPVYPNEAYEDKGWQSWSDWLGNNNIAPRFFQYRLFEEARAFVRGLGLKNGEEWKKYCRSDQKPADIPATPSSTYKNKGWKGLPDWLGTGRQYKSFRTFSQARAYVHTLKLKDTDEWRDYCRAKKLPPDIPKAPWQCYENEGWISVPDWLGTDTLASCNRQWQSYEGARAFAQELGIKSSTEWRKHWRTHQRPDDIPANPDRVYTEEWKTWGDFLDTGTAASQLRRYLPYHEARAYMHKLKLKNQAKWKEYCRSGERPEGIPSNPWEVYKRQGWTGYGDWLGNGRIANKDKPFWSFDKAKAYVRKQRLKNLSEWTEYCSSGKKPSQIPTNPARTYKGKGWIGLRDWLG